MLALPGLTLVAQGEGDYLSANSQGSERVAPADTALDARPLEAERSFGIQQALVSARGGTDAGGGRKYIDPGRLPDGVAFAAGVPYAGVNSTERQRLDVIHFRDSDSARPTIVLIHGGGFYLGERSWCHELMAMYAEEGYVTLSVGYRLAQDAPYPAQIEDCKLAIRWLRANADAYGVDPERIACMGGSAGAILAALVAFTDAADGLEGEDHLEQSSRVQAAVMLSAAYDFRPASLARLQEERPIAAKFPGGLSLLLERAPAARAAIVERIRGLRQNLWVDLK